jgi:hypothetical protein
MSQIRDPRHGALRQDKMQFLFGMEGGRIWHRGKQHIRQGPHDQHDDDQVLSDRREMSHHGR